MAMHVDNRGVDLGVFYIWLVGNGVEHTLENIRLHLIAEALEHRVPLAKHRWQVTPRATGTRNPQHRLRVQTAVATRPTRVGWFATAKRSQLLSLRVRQKQPIHRKLLLELKSRPASPRESPDSH